MFRYANINDLNRVYEIEKECFPESEAASFNSLKHRIENGFFLLLEEEHEILSFINGMYSNEKDLKDEMYKGKYCVKNGDWLMIFGVDTMPSYRRQGCAEQLLRHVIETARNQGRKGLVLTCKETLLHYYGKFGFVNEGVSRSTHGNVIWYQMRLTF